MKVKITIFLLFLVSLLVSSCSVRVSAEEALDLSNGGAISLKLSASELPSATRAISIPEVSNSLIEITSIRANDEGGYDKPYNGLYTLMPLAVAVPDGGYVVSATLGDSEPFTVVGPTFYGEQEVEIFVAHNLAVALELKMLSYAVEVDLTDKFLETFERFSVDVQIGGESYNFADNIGEIAYLAPGSSQLIFSGVTKTGQEVMQNLGTLTSLGCEHHILTLDIRAAGHAFEILVDREIINYDISADVDSELYPDMPKASYGALNFCESEIIVDEASDNSRITLSSLVSVKSATIQFVDAKFASISIDNTRIYDLSLLTDIYALIALGFVIEPGGVIGVNNPNIYLGSLSERLLSYGGVATTYDIAINVVDHLDESATTIVPIVVEAPVFSMPEMNPGNVWTKEFTFDPITSDNVAKGNYDMMLSNGGFLYQMSSDGANWSDIAVGNTTCANLTQSVLGSQYYIRAKYRDMYSEQVAVTTAPARQIPNSNFESYQNTKETGGGPFYRWKLDGEEWWDSRNSLTAAKEGGNYWYTSQASSRPDIGRSGHGVQIVTVGYGSANTWAGYLWSAGIHNISSGRLFIGQYSGGQKNGKEFNSRPSAMTYYYKFIRHPDEEDTNIAKIWVENRDEPEPVTIGEGSFSTTANVGSYTQKRIDISYSRTDLAATHICIEFMSGVKEGAKKYLYDRYQEPRPYTYGDDWYYYGSRFWVDDVVLIYDK